MQKTFSLHSISPEGYKASKYTLLGYLYFFFNSVLLPKGMLYTNILSPLFFYHSYRRGKRLFLIRFLLFLITFDIIHIRNGVDTMSFIISNGLFVSTYMCTVAAWHFFNDAEMTGRIFRNVLLLNAVLVLIALPFLFIPALRDRFWYTRTFTNGVTDLPRLALFTYEASYYSLLMVPVFYYFIAKFATGQMVKNRSATLAMVIVPFILSLSFGVIGATLITALILAVVYCRRIFSSKRGFLFFLGSISLAAAAISFILLWPGNPLLVRLTNILSGEDSSANGRTLDSFRMAWLIASEKDIYTGCGLGQVKFMAVDVVRTYMKHWGEFPRYDIPNAMGETLAIFGVAGVVIRISLEVFLFIRTKVHTNYYRLSLFVFLFIYQFTGSFITNIAEYVAWCIAFSSAFHRFDLKPLKS